MAINQRLLTARKRMHWSQKKAADACKVDLQTFFRWEHGEQLPHGYNLEQLCDVFQASATDLGYAPDEILIEEGEPTMDPSRRNALKTFAAVTSIAITGPLSLVDPEPWDRLAFANAKPIGQETILHFKTLLDTCRSLTNGIEMRVAENLLSQLLPRFIELAPHQPEMQSLTAQGLHLSSIIAAHHLNLEEKVLLCQQAVNYARQANIPTILAASLLELAVAFQYNNNPAQALQTYQEALLYSDQMSPVLQARTYAETGFALAKHGRKQEALFYVGLAYDTLPDHPELDPNFALSDFCTQGTLSLYSGLIHLEREKPHDAWNGFEKFKSYSTTLVPERIRLEIVNHQGRAALLAKNLDAYAACLNDGLAGAIVLKSQKRYNEALTFMQQVPSTWLREPQIRHITEQFALK